MKLLSILFTTGNGVEASEALFPLDVGKWWPYGCFGADLRGDSHFRRRIYLFQFGIYPLVSGLMFNCCCFALLIESLAKTDSGVVLNSKLNVRVSQTALHTSKMN